MKTSKILLAFCMIGCLCISGCSTSGPAATQSISPTSEATYSPTQVSESPSQSTDTDPATQTATPTQTTKPVTIPLQQKIKMTDAQRAGKVAYITIDDGPSKNTEAILAVLRSKGVKATFFLLGKNAEKYPQAVKDIVADGNAIGNHSYSHVYAQIYASPDTLKDEIVHTNNIIQGVLGQDYKVTLFRFPGGLKQGDPAYTQVVYDLGMDFYAWSIDSQDSVGGKSSSDVIVQKINSQLGSQKHPVILIHDADNKDTTVQALPAIIDNLRAKGFSFDVIVKNS